MQIDKLGSIRHRGNKLIYWDDRAIKIVFPHRTVKDYLADPDVQKYIEDRVGKSFDAPLSMCRLHLARAKSLAHKLSLSLKPRGWQRFDDIASHVMYHAKAYEIRNAAPLTAILDEFDRVFDQFGGPNWADLAILDERRVHQSTAFRAESESNCLAFAVSNDLLHFVSEVLERDPGAIHKAGRPLLDYAIYPSVLTGGWVQFERGTSLKMIQLLLNAGADIDSKVKVLGDESVWQVVLLELYLGGNDGVRSGVLDTAIAFIDHGADIDCKIPIKSSTFARSRIELHSKQERLPSNLIEAEIVEKEYATVFECLDGVLSSEEASKLLADARSNRNESLQPPTPQSQTRTSWLMPWSG